MYLFFRKLLSIFFHIKYKINVLHPENIPSAKGGYIIACNHQKYADPPMIAAVVRGKFSFMAKEELFNLRFQAATGQLDNNSRLRIVKREIARIYTVLREHELGIMPLAAEESADKAKEAAE